ncbi:glutaredoxin [Coemansia erecta]|uniref:Glutaredoxin n=1 Tax=Coemansia erecta TaxID=147472 RepID=A0A9W7Y1A9_9FUNG|nr:glutaredoxin [Coemansia erecta]
MSASKNIVQIKEEKELRSTLEETSQAAVLYFWASWAEQCKQVESVVDDLATKYSKTQFFKIEAEEFEEISDAYEINAVPTVIIAKKAKILARVEGANVAEVVSQVASNCGAANGVGGKQPSADTKPEFKQDLNTRLKGLIERAPVMVFIKGTAAQPRCGFSRKIVGMLNEQNIKYGFFDILTDEQVRQGLKEYSDWPTYPQLYIKGELVGGVDIVSEMIASGELTEMIPEGSLAK